MQLEPHGRDWSLLVNWDDLGKLYAGVIVAWTVILGSGVAWLILHRRVPSVRLRNVSLSIAAVSFLHVYLVKIFLAYTTNGHFSCAAEFWIMSIYLPFGIALFQANTVQLESISEEQQSLLRRDSDLDQDIVKMPPKQARSFWYRWYTGTAAERMYIYIGLGMAIQLLVTGVLYATTPTLHGDWSSYGNLPFRKGQAKCRSSLEWIPSAFWQLFWSWVYGPYILYKIRNIKDVHYWRLQVFLTVLSGLPGVPLWLVALYGPPAAMHRVNKWWVPPMWLAPGIMVMQAVTTFFPIYEAYKDRSQLRKTLGILDSWEKSRKNDERQSMSNNTSLTSYEKSFTSTPDPAHRRSEMYTMAALEKALAVNPNPLLHFAATQDFTAENVVFLTHVRHWHTEWDRAVSHDGTISSPDQTRLLTLALRIYMISISTVTADFPVNIEGRVRSALDKVFGPCVPVRRTFAGGSDTSEPFDFDSPPTMKLQNMQNVMRREPSTDSATTLTDGPLSLSDDFKYSFEALPSVQSSRSKIVIDGRSFGRKVFDDAEASVKYLVLTNTWQKLVKSHEHMEIV